MSGSSEVLPTIEAEQMRKYQEQRQALELRKQQLLEARKHLELTKPKQVK